MTEPFSGVRSAVFVRIPDRRSAATGFSGVAPDESPEASATAALRECGLLRFTIDKLLERGEVQLRELRQVLKSGDADAVVRLTHGLGGNVGMFGGDELAKLCADLEEEVELSGSVPRLNRDGRFEAIASAWRTFTRHLKEIRDAEADRA